MKKIISKHFLSRLVRIFLAIFTILLIPDRAFAAFTCSTSCNSQCSVDTWLGETLVPGCYQSCKVWQLTKCYDIEDLRNHTWGEIGTKLYPAGAIAISGLNPFFFPLTIKQKFKLSRIFNDLIASGALSAEYKEYLDDLFFNVRVHYDAQLLDEISVDTLFPGNDPIKATIKRLIFGDRLEFGQLIGSYAQTFGYDIYVTYPRGVGDQSDNIAILAHEMIHTLQYLNRGAALEAFGRDYFKGFDSAGLSYEGNPMEQEAYHFQDKVEESPLLLTSASNVDGGNFELCNKSNVDTIWAATGHYHPDLSLVPIVNSVGWYRLDKGECRTLLNNIAKGDQAWYFATSNTTGIYPANHWGHNGSKTFCVDTVNTFNFEYGYPCNGATETQIHTFDDVIPPTHTGGTTTIGLTGGIEHSVVRLCNSHSKAVTVAQLAYEPKNGWISRGWTKIDPSQCINNDFGLSTNKVYYYATSFEGLEWPTTKNPGDVEFCVKPTEGSWSFLQARNNMCAQEGGVFISGAMVDTVSGVTRVNIMPSQLTHTLTITNTHTGLGQGKITSLPAGISCGETCSASFNGGIVSGTVTLIALPDEGSNFAGWSGCTRLIGTDKCSVVMTKNQNAEAKFTDRPVLVIDKRGTGSGTVISNPSGIDCGIDCIEDYVIGNNFISLQAKPSEGSIFTGWFGFQAKECSGTNDGKINVNSFHYCIAQFDTAPTNFALTVSKNGTGTGAVFTANTGIDCGEDCTENYATDAQVALIPLPDRGSVFRGWNGACSGTGACTITMYANQNINATFTTANPMIFTVTNLNDSGPGSLRQAILDANTNAGDDTVNFASGLSGVIALTGGQLDITDSIVVNGPGARMLTISSNHASRIFEINPGTIGTVAINGLTLKEGNDVSGNGGGGVIIDSGTVTINNSTLSNNAANSGGGGGGIRKFGPGKLTVSNSTVSGNSAIDEFGQGAGGGIRNDQETLTVINSTVSGNSAASGGGITFDDGRLIISNSTVTGNSAVLGGGGIFTGGGEFVLGNSIVAGNQAPADKEVQNFGTMISQGHNLIGENGVSGITAGITLAVNDFILADAITTAIAPLAYNGGQTQTHLPIAASPAIDAGDNNLILQGVTTDQRDTGFPRIMNGTVDIGAVESIIKYTLSISKTGAGDGRVISTPSGIDCGVKCSVRFKKNRRITLTAIAGQQSVFSGWTGDCSGKQPCRITMSGDHFVEAEFALKHYLLSVVKQGNGFVTSDIPGIECGNSCSKSYLSATKLTLTATPEPGSSFVQWKGSCKGRSNPCTVTMLKARSVTAIFK